jgi:hypothetical protein
MNPQTDERLEKVEQITIDFEVFKKTLERNYLTEPDQWGRTFVLRLLPPFEAEMEAEYYESEQGRHYNNEWDEKPFHIRPEILILESPESTSNFFNHHQWPTEINQERLIEQEFPDVEATEENVQEFVEEGREWYWNEMKSVLPEEFNLGVCTVHGNYTVDINWTNLE